MKFNCLGSMLTIRDTQSSSVTAFGRYARQSWTLVLIALGCVATSSPSYAELFVGSAEYLESHELQIACEEDEFCMNPWLNLYQFIGVSVGSGEDVEFVAYNSGSIIRTEYLWLANMERTDNGFSFDDTIAEYSINTLELSQEFFCTDNPKLAERLEPDVQLAGETKPCFSEETIYEGLPERAESEDDLE
ncbi:MAG: hypothetical protein AAGL69_07255 [Pseudomonadota bacterium]